MMMLWDAPFDLRLLQCIVLASLWALSLVLVASSAIALLQKMLPGVAVELLARRSGSAQADDWQATPPKKLRKRKDAARTGLSTHVGTCEIAVSHSFEGTAQKIESKSDVVNETHALIDSASNSFDAELQSGMAIDECTPNLSSTSCEDHLAFLRPKAEALSLEVQTACTVSTSDGCSPKSHASNCEFSALALDTESETDADAYEVVLHRTDGELWGVAWNFAAHTSGRLIVNGVTPRLPADRWCAGQRVSGLRSMEPGDEVVAINGSTDIRNMMRELRIDNSQVTLKVLRASHSRHPSTSTALPLSSSPPPRSVSRQSHWNCMVKNTFIEVTDGVEDDLFSRSDPSPMLAAVAALKSSRVAFTPGSLLNSPVGDAAKLTDAADIGDIGEATEVTTVDEVSTTSSCFGEGETTRPHTEDEFEDLQTDDEFEPSLASASVAQDMISLAFSRTSSNVDGSISVASDERTPLGNNDTVSVGAPGFVGLLGKKVQIVGLTRSPEFNGRLGQIEYFDVGSQRLSVRIDLEDGRTVLAKLLRENVLHLADPSLVVPHQQDTTCKNEYDGLLHESLFTSPSEHLLAGAGSTPELSCAAVREVCALQSHDVSASCFWANQIRLGTSWMPSLRSTIAR